MSLYQEIPQPIIIQGGGGGGAGTVSGVGAFASTAQGPNGAIISGSNIIFGPSDFNNPGMMSSSAQSIGGPKTFNSISTWNVANLVMGANANIAITDSSSAFLARSTAANCTGFGAGNVFNRIVTGNLNTAFGWGNLTNAITGGNNSAFGAGCLTALTGGTDNIAIGVSTCQSINNGKFNCVVGNSGGPVISTGSANTLMGYSVSATGNGVTTGSHNVIIGAFAGNTVAIGNYNILLGSGADNISTTASNFLVVGGSSAGGGVTNGFFGNGITNASPQAFTFNATGGSGSNIAGANLIIASGRGTGSALGGQIIFRTTVATSSGTTVNPFADAMSIDGNQNVAVGAAAIATSANTGFLYIPSCAGTPTGTPTTKTGLVPMVFDTTGVKIWFYTGSAWKGVVVA